MTDEHVGELFDRFRTGELGAAERERVGAHLVSCAACRAGLAELEAFSAEVARGYAAAREAAPERDWAAQREAILARTSERRSPRRGWLGGWVPQAAAAAIAVIAIGVLWRAEIRGPGAAERAAAPTASAGADAAVAARADAPTDTRASSGVAPSILRDRADGERLEEGRRQDERLDRPAAPEGFADREADLEAAPERANADRADDGLEEMAEEEQRQGQEPVQPAAREAPSELRAEPKVVEKNEAANRAAADQVGAVVDASRFEAQARGALADRDALAAGRTYALWRDTLAAGEAMTPERRAELQALADSLAALLAARP